MKPQPTRVLIVSDQPADVRVLAEALGNELEVVVADSTSRALDLASSAGLVLVDALMKDLDAPDLCRRLASGEATKGIPVVFVTAPEPTEDPTRWLDAGAADCITRPIHQGIVRARVRAHLELRAARERLEHLATQDALTGIANRRRFDEAVDEEWRRSMRTSHFLTLALADLDHFNAFNNRHGHDRGDTCLRLVAGALQRLSRRPGELVARYGGEEFAFLLPDVDLEGARLFVARVLHAVGGVEVEGLPGPGSLGVSVGAVTLIPSPLNSLEDALRAAHEGVHRAKETGRHRGVVRDLETGADSEVVAGG